MKQAYIRLKNYFADLKRWQRRCLVVLVILLGLTISHMILERAIPEVENPVYGTSFSIKYASELGNNWQDNFLALLDDLKIRQFRLMSYWDRIEQKEGVYNFKDLDWQMDQAAKRGAKVSLAVGLRQPRWPECHRPTWATKLSSTAKKNAALLKFVTTVVNRYKKHPALTSYQLENEALNKHFGLCSSADISQSRITQEFKMVKKLDPHHPVYMSLSDQHGLPLGNPVPDKYGFSIYRTVFNNKFGPIHSYVTYPTPVWYHRLRAWWIQTFKHREIFIHELQLEPWGPKATKKLSVEEQNKSMSPKQITQNLKFARKVGAGHIDTWGSEWWYWRKTVHKDPSIWNAVKKELGT